MKSGILIKYRVYYSITLFLLILITGIAIFQCPVQASSNTSPVELTDGWKYIWSHYTAEESILLPISSGYVEDLDWKDYVYSKKPLKRDPKYTIAHFKIELPEADWESPALFLGRVYAKSLKVYLEGIEIYRYQNMKPVLEATLFSQNGFIIPLGHNNAGGKTLILEVSSDLQLIGPCGNAVIGSHTDIIKKYINKDFYFVVLGFFFLFFGAIMLPNIAFLKGREKKSFISLGLFLISLGVFYISECDIVEVILFKSPVFWTYINMTAFFLAPLFFMYFFEQIFTDGHKSLVRILWKVHILYIFIYFAVIILNFASRFAVGESISLLANCFYALVLTDFISAIIITIIRALKGNTDARIFTAGFALFALLTVYEVFMFVVLSVKPFMLQWGILIFIGSLVLITGRRFAALHSDLFKYSLELESKNETLNKMWLEVLKSRDQMAEWNKSLEQSVMERTADLRNLLDNAGQGFLTFGCDLLVHKEYSSECTNIFGYEIKDKLITELIYTNPEQQKYLGLMFSKILNETNMVKQDLYVQLLPKEVNINGKYIHISYKIVQSTQDAGIPAFMVILTDITEKKALEEQMEKERKTLKMVVKAVIDNSTLKRFIKDYKNFFSFKLNAILESEQPTGSIHFEILRCIHAFKGTAAQLDMLHTSNGLHEIENDLINLKSDDNHIAKEKIQHLIRKEFLENYIAEDLSILSKILGDQFLTSEETMLIEESQLQALEIKVLAVLPQQYHKELLPYIRRLRCKPLKNMLNSYSEYVSTLSQKLQKPLKPLVIEGDNILIEPGKYHSFIQSLGHVFRNAVDHGIEPIEERIAQSKDKLGVIKCCVKAFDTYICISISDDGRGINPECILDKAVKKGIIHADHLDSKSEDEVMSLLFREGFSTRKDVNIVSGRGIGLTDVKKEIDNIHGKIEVKTYMNKGTEFCFFLPLEDSLVVPA